MAAMCTVFTAICHNGEVRLVDGERENEGRLGVCFNKRWGTVGSDWWSNNNTHTVCSDLGFRNTGLKTML